MRLVKTFEKHRGGIENGGGGGDMSGEGPFGSEEKFIQSPFSHTESLAQTFFFLVSTGALLPQPQKG